MSVFGAYSFNEKESWGVNFHEKESWGMFIDHVSYGFAAKVKAEPGWFVENEAGVSKQGVPCDLNLVRKPVYFVHFYQVQ